jgi:thiol-disulfide isomerase/thioredoxin
MFRCEIFERCGLHGSRAHTVVITMDDYNGRAMKRIAVLVFAFAAMLPARAGDDALALLHQVSDAYKSLKTYHIEQEAESLLSTELHHSWQKNFTTLAVGDHDRVRFELKEDTNWHIVVSDGKTVWRATPYIREWSRTELAGPLADLKNGGSEGDMAINRLKVAMRFYPRLTDEVTNAEIIGHENVEVGGMAFVCTVVRADNQPPRGAVGIRSWTRTYWIDDASHVILKDESITRGHLMPSAPFNEGESRWLTRVTFLSLNEPLPDTLFNYTPPANFGEVDKLERAYPRPAKDLIGKPAPELTLKTLDGKEMSLSSLRGKTVLLDFWATWCAPCREQLPALAKLYAILKNQNAVLLGVDDDENPEKALAYMTEKHYDWPSLFGGPKSDARTKYKVDAIPTLVLIDKDGVIVAYQTGSGEITEKAIRSALRQQGIQITE